MDITDLVISERDICEALKIISKRCPYIKCFHQLPTPNVCAILMDKNIKTQVGYQLETFVYLKELKLSWYPYPTNSNASINFYQSLSRCKTISSLELHQIPFGTTQLFCLLFGQKLNYFPEPSASGLRGLICLSAAKRLVVTIERCLTFGPSWDSTPMMCTSAWTHLAKS